ncbi:MAG: undecaprenyl diphosphate synthase family protein, partial [Methanoculleus sp.]
LVIKTGGDHLTDFLIWQSVYSELFFLDVNWALLRKVDFLRALRDFQSRARRFGR